MSIACWFQNSVPPSDRSGLVTKGYDKPIGGAGGDARPWYLVYFLASGTVDPYLRDADGANSRALGKIPVNDGKWHHVVAMKDADTTLKSRIAGLWLDHFTTKWHRLEHLKIRPEFRAD